MTRITGLNAYDLRFPMSDTLDGSDAMNPDPNYSAASAALELPVSPGFSTFAET